MLDQLQDERRGCAGEGEKRSKKSAAKSIMEALREKAERLSDLWREY